MRARQLGYTMFKFTGVGCAISAAAVLCLAAAPSYAETLYSTGNDGTSLYTVDSTTGASQQVGYFGFGATYALAFSPDDTLYALVDGYNFQGRLATINTTTGAASVFGAPTGVPNLWAMAFDPDGTLYAASWGTNSLYTLNTTTGAATLIGSLGFSGVIDLAFDSTGQLWGISQGLYRIDTATGLGAMAHSSVGGGCLAGLTITQADRFLATNYCGANGGLFEINPTTGAHTLIGNTGINSPVGLTDRGVAAPGAVPEPATWAMMILGVFGTGAMVRRRQWLGAAA